MIVTTLPFCNDRPHLCT